MPIANNVTQMNFFIDVFPAGKIVFCVEMEIHVCSAKQAIN